ncbi:7122_t:CDS:1 [Paraglomus brasilianum]|uniref:7122_t:CDS:1 n=1 Tax=Paraglomus brasilianum TaxID=144538 RepID=A0A9N9DRC9_9GLOM|nr:7122_t:CDS:1 [Paraglomus brasilianum]
MDENKWEDFRVEIKRKIEALEIKKITDEASLNKAWHKLYIAIKHLADKHIKWLKIYNNYFRVKTKKASELYQGLVKINKLIRNLKELKSHPPFSYEEVTKRFNKKIGSLTTKLGLENIKIKEQDFWNKNFKQLVESMIELKKSIHVTTQIENNSEIREEISLAVERRQNNFQTNTKRIIDSILKRKRNRVTFDNIIKVDEVITDGKGIKEEVVMHFKNWTKYNPTNKEYWKLWEKEYDPVLQRL